MHLRRDSLGRCEIVGDGDFLASLRAPSMIHGISAQPKGTKVVAKFDREIDNYGDFWLAFVSPVDGLPGDFVTLGSRFSEDIKPLVDNFVQRHGFVLVETSFTPAAKGQRATLIETTS